jgi:hypothetical protein
MEAASVPPNPGLVMRSSCLNCSNTAVTITPVDGMVNVVFGLYASAKLTNDEFAVQRTNL